MPFLKHIRIFFAAVLLGLPAGAAAPEGLSVRQRLQADVNCLCDTLFTGRGTSTPGGVLTAWWLADRFREAGLEAPDGLYTRSWVLPDGTTGHNVVGWRPCAAHPERFILIAAHFDNLGVLKGRMYPGADSNASGVAALLELVRTLKGIPAGILFVALDGKGRDMAGSRALWEQLDAGGLREPGSGRVLSPGNLRLMVNLEQMGSTLTPLKSGRKDYLVMLGRESLPRKARGLELRCNPPSTGLELAFDYYGSRDFTRLFYQKVGDQRIFVEHGKSAVVFTSGITMNTNRTYDLPATLDYGILERRIAFIARWLRTAAPLL